MEYAINKLAKLAGVSSRTLRYYDEIGLLPALRVSSNGYRVYGGNEVDRLQQILFYRELGVPLEEIRSILAAKNFDGLSALRRHMAALLARREQLDALINNVDKTIKAMKGEGSMSDGEKFKGFVQKMVDENEQRYGAEIRAKYGDESIDRSNAKVLGMRQEQYKGIERLTEEFNKTIREAMRLGDPAGETAQKACALHKAWLLNYWESYSKEAHLGVTQMYVDDPRFTAFYDRIAPGCAAFLRDAVAVFCG